MNFSSRDLGKWNEYERSSAHPGMRNLQSVFVYDLTVIEEKIKIGPAREIAPVIFGFPKVALDCPHRTEQVLRGE